MRAKSRLVRDSAPPLNQQNFFRLIHFAQLNLDDFVSRGLHPPANELRFYRQLAMTSINKHAELHPLWTPMTEQRIHGGARRPPGIQNIINQDDVLSRDGDPNLALLHHWLRPECGKVVTV